MEKYIIDMKNNNSNYNKLDRPAEIMKKGGIVVFPTETVYGIGTNGLNEEAIKKLYNIKRRSLSNPISLLISNVHMIESVAENITDIEYKLIEKFFPGQLTLIVKKKDIVPNILTANSDTVGVRMPQNEIALKLIDKAGVPIAASSSNISGNASQTNLDSKMEEFAGKVDYYIDGGECKIGIASTVVQIINGVPHILREGSISKKQIMDAINI